MGNNAALDKIKKNKAIMDLYEPLLSEIEEKIEHYKSLCNKVDEDSIEYKSYSKLIDDLMDNQANTLALLNMFLKN